MNTQGIRYLGITLTLSAAFLAQANFLPLITKIKSQLQHMAQCELTWVGGLAGFKIVIYLQILYIFRVLPIPIPALT